MRFGLLWMLCIVGLSANAQISLVKEFSPCCSVGPFESMGNYFLFNANGGLWRSDGTTAGTTFVAWVMLPRANWRCRIGNTLYFHINDGELWKTDGTPAGTQLVKALGFGFQGPLVNVNGLLVFGFNEAATGTELWRSDGTEAGTYLITDLLPGTGNGYNYVSPQTAVLDGYFYFQGGAPVPTNVPNVGSRVTLYRTNGTTAGTTQVANGGFEPYSMNAQNGRLVYRAGQPASYTCQGTAYTDYTAVLMKIENGIAIILKRPADVYPFGNTGCPLTPLGSTFSNTYQFVNAGSYQYFRAQTETAFGQSPGFNIWRTDGTTNGTIPVTNFPANSIDGPYGDAQWVWSSGARSDFNFSNLVYFPIRTSTAGVELWRSDGTTAGTYLLRDINPMGDANPLVARTVNSTTYFFANDGTNGKELWRTDGTTAGTQLVQDLSPGTGEQQPTHETVIAFGQNLYFSANTGVPYGVHGLYTTFTCTEMISLKNGSWNDPTVWSCGRVPIVTDAVTVNHAVTIPVSFQANARRLIYGLGGRLIYSTDGRLQLGQ